MKTRSLIDQRLTPAAPEDDAAGASAIVAPSSIMMTPTMRLQYVARTLNDLRNSNDYPAATDPETNSAGWAFRDEVNTVYLRCLATDTAATEREICNRLNRLRLQCTSRLKPFALAVDEAIAMLNLPTHGWTMPRRWRKPVRRA
jgi:hypothetical protein